MTKAHRVIAAGLVFGVVAFKAFVPSHIAPAFLYPDPKFTPGKVDTTNIEDILKPYDGQTYSQAHRNVTMATVKQACTHYSCNSPNEKDHFIPLALGGSNEIQNIWVQNENVTWNGEDWGFHKKDKLEAYIVRKVKAREMTLTQGQDCFRIDWVRCYKTYITNIKGIGDNTPFE